MRIPHAPVVVGLLGALLLVVAAHPATGQESRADAPAQVAVVDRALKDLELIRPRRTAESQAFEVPILTGGVFRLEEHRGRVVVVNFWATWCLPCREEMPALERLWRRYRGRAFTLVAISIDTDAALVPPFVTSYRLTFPIGHDVSGQVAKRFGARAMPTTLIVDSAGHLVALAFGARPWDGKAAAALIDALLP